MPKSDGTLTILECAALVNRSTTWVKHHKRSGDIPKRPTGDELREAFERIEGRRREARSMNAAKARAKLFRKPRSKKIATIQMVSDKTGHSVAKLNQWFQKGWLPEVCPGARPRTVKLSDISKTEVKAAKARAEQPKKMRAAKPPRKAKERLVDALDRVDPQNDVTIESLAKRVVRDESLSKKRQRVESIIDSHNIPTTLKSGSVVPSQRRDSKGRPLRPRRKPVLTVPKEQAEIILKILAIPDQPADMLSDRQARDLFHVSRQRLGKAIEEFAPDSGVEMAVRNGRGVRTKVLRPRAAIEAALRGEHWTPQPNPQPMPAAARKTERVPDPPEAELLNVGGRSTDPIRDAMRQFIPRHPQRPPPNRRKVIQGRVRG